MDERIEANLKNAQAVAEFRYNALYCPKCRSNTSKAYFSVDDHEERYGIWFECGDCGNVEHISCGRKPEGFSAERVSRKFQDLDERAWRVEKR